MEFRNITAQGIRAALVRANASFDGNLEFNNFEAINKKETAFRITIRVRDSSGKGARLSQGFTSKGNRRHMPFACWHAYGTFIDKVFEVAETATVKVGGQRYTKDTWTWEDRNIGSMMNPLMYSEACECTI